MIQPFYMRCSKRFNSAQKFPYIDLLIKNEMISNISNIYTDMKRVPTSALVTSRQAIFVFVCSILEYSLTL